MIGNILFAEMNDLESVRKLVSEKTCAILLETLQGEGGIHPADAEFLEGIRKICDEKDYRMFGSFFDGKGQPSQVSAVSHGSSTARFNGVNVINTGRTI